MFELETRLPACSDHNETQLSSFKTDASGRSDMSKATDIEIKFVCVGYIEIHNNILNLIGVSSTFATSANEAEFRRDDIKLHRTSLWRICRAHVFNLYER
jgi:hypothetical protein